MISLCPILYSRAHKTIGDGEEISYFLDVLALELGEELLNALVVGINTDGGENIVDIAGRWRGVAGKAEEKESCEVLHFEMFSIYNC